VQHRLSEPASTPDLSFLFLSFSCRPHG
jgi:hypothetical protein